MLTVSFRSPGSVLYLLIKTNNCSVALDQGGGAGGVCLEVKPRIINGECSPPLHLSPTLSERVCGPVLVSGRVVVGCCQRL